MVFLIKDGYTAAFVKDRVHENLRDIGRIQINHCIDSYGQSCCQPVRRLLMLIRQKLLVQGYCASLAYPAIIYDAIIISKGPFTWGVKLGQLGFMQLVMRNT